MSKTDASPFAAHWRRRPDTFIVASAVLDRVQHQADVRFRILINQTGNSAHLLVELAVRIICCDAHALARAPNRKVSTDGSKNANLNRDNYLSLRFHGPRSHLA